MLFRSGLMDESIPEDKELLERFNKNSLEVLHGYAEAALSETKAGVHYQFIRNGYYVTDKDSTDTLKVFNRTCSLKSSYKKK